MPENIQDIIRKIQRDTSIDSKDKPRLISEAMKNNTKVVNERLTKKESETNLKCTHYIRKCDIQCFECEKFYPCRICHDENNDHKLDRFKINKIKCRICNTVQVPSQTCTNCKQMFSTYYCNVCNLWESDGSKKIFHCGKCGICRIGCRTDYIHCDKCNHCYSKEFYENHKCVSDNTHTNCPICEEYMFDSKSPISILKCGHSIHRKCWEDLLKHGDYKCPFCKKTVTNGMEEQWKMYDMLASFEPMPEEFKDKRLVIYCNDCEKKSDIKFSFEFRKCSACGGYNTTEVDCYDAINMD